MTSLKNIIDALDPVDGGWRGQIPENWLQGRTAYGGLSAALALHAAQNSDTDLPPLRSAQVSFIGPLSGDIVIRASRLRRGRNAAFVQADIESEAGLGLRATFVFMGPTGSAIDHESSTPPDFAIPDATTKTYSPTNHAIAFVRNFEFVDRRDDSVGPAEWLRWVRLTEREGIDPAVELMAIADCLPPAAMRLMTTPAAISSMTWLVNLLTPAPATQDGWWLLRANATYARDGASSQDMNVWNADGRPIAAQMQSIALF